MDADNFVSEYPLPPIYYKRFTSDTCTTINPPIIDNQNLRNLCYGSSLQAQIGSNGSFNEHINYKNELLK